MISLLQGNAGMAAYSSSKAAVIGFVKAVGKEYADTGITINALAPAMIEDGMIRTYTPEEKKLFEEKIPMKR